MFNLDFFAVPGARLKSRLFLLKIGNVMMKK
jgi:hypothetical protein